MLKIRLARGGRKNVPFYRIVVTNHTSPRDSKFLEKLGTYNPLANDTDEKKIVVNKERVEHWLSVGAKPTDRVALFLVNLGCKGAEKYKPEFEPRKKGEGAKKKALAKMQAEIDAVEALKAAEIAAIEAEKAEKVAAAQAAAAEKEAAAVAKETAAAVEEVAAPVAATQETA